MVARIPDRVLKCVSVVRFTASRDCSYRFVLEIDHVTSDIILSVFRLDRYGFRSQSQNFGIFTYLVIHKSEGLAPINNQCESTIPGLFAVGGALGSYMVGAIYTQIGSSLAGSAV